MASQSLLTHVMWLRHCFMKLSWDLPCTYLTNKGLQWSFDSFMPSCAILGMLVYELRMWSKWWKFCMGRDVVSQWVIPVCEHKEKLPDESIENTNSYLFVFFFGLFSFTWCVYWYALCFFWRYRWVCFWSLFYLCLLMSRFKILSGY